MRTSKFNINRKYSISAILLLLITGFFLFSCGVGLGEAVDTYPPTLTLEYPENDGITIMDTFMMSGVAKDETYIKTVELSVKSVKDKSIVQKYSAELDSKAKTWSCLLNKQDENGNYEIPDGEYTIDVIAIDSSDRTTELSRVYKIDNTAPVVIIKRPKIDDSYGRTIKLTGDISDENELSALYFTAFKNFGTKETPDFQQVGSTQKFENISGVGLELIIGRYFEEGEAQTEDEQNQKAIYDAYYGDATGNSDSIYALIEVSDVANVYKGKKTTDLANVIIPAMGTYSGSTTGNLSTCYYLENKIYNEIKKDKKNGGLGLNGSDLVQVFNGTFNESSGVTIKQIKEILEKYAINTTAISSDLSTFTINPDNFPSFVATGYEKYKNAYLTKDGPLSLRVSPGRDQISLTTESIRVVLDKCDSDGNLVYKTEAEKKANEIVLIESKENIQEMLSSDDPSIVEKGNTYLSEWETSVEDGDFVTITVDHVTGTAPDGKAYKTGSHYKIRVDGEDLEGNIIESQNHTDYMFLFKNGKAPVLEITDGVENNAVLNRPFGKNAEADKTENIFHYSGTLDTDAELSDLHLYYYVSVKDEKGSSFTKVYSTKKENYKDYEGTIASVENPVEGSAAYTWEISFGEESDILKELKALIDDDEVSVNNGLFLYTIGIYAYDGDQATQTASRLVHVDNEMPTSTISAITPTVEYSDDADLPYSDLESGITYINGKVQVKGNAADNYQLEKIVICAFILDEDGNPASETPIVSSEVLGSMSFNFEIDTLSETFKDIPDGTKMLIKAIPYDTAENQGEAAEKIVTIDQRTDEPIFAPSNASKTITRIEDVNVDTNNMFGITSNNKIIANVSDDDGVYSWTAYYSTDGGNNWVGYPNSPFDSKYGIDSTTATIEINLAKIPNLSEGEYKIRVRVTDVGEKGTSGKVSGTERSSDDSFVIAIDEASPAINSTSYQTGEMLPSEKEVTITGNVSDGSGTVTLTRMRQRVLIDEEGKESLEEARDEAEVISYTNNTGKVDWSDTLTTIGASEVLIYTATDRYGRNSTWSFRYQVDDADPIIVITAPEDNSYLGAASGNTTKAFNGTSDDNAGTGNSGVSKVEYSTDGGSTWTSANGTKQWNANIELGKENCTKTVMLRAWDNADRTSETVTRTVIVDGTLPVITITSIEDKDRNPVLAQEGTYYVKSSYTIKGTVEEANFDMLKISGEEVEVTSGSDGKTHSFSHTVEIPQNAESGATSISFSALDKAGQKSESSINVYYDGSYPVLNFSVTPLVSANGKENNVNGSVTTKGTAIDDDKISSSRMTIMETETGKVVYDAPTSNPTNFQTPISLTMFIEGLEYNGKSVKISDKKAYTITMTSTDRSGRVGKVALPVYVDQDTDYPIVNLSNTNVKISTHEQVSSTTVTSETESENRGNLFNQTSNNKMLGTITDDDGIASVKVEYAPLTETPGTNGSASTYSVGSYEQLFMVENVGTTYNFSVDLKKNGAALAEGKYKIRLSVLDTTSDADTHETHYEYFIGIDNGAPSLSVSTPSGYKPETFTVEGKATDVAFEKLSCFKTKEVNGIKVRDGDAFATWEKAAATNSINYSPSTGIWTHEYNSITDGGTVIYVAEDEYGQSTEVSWTWLFDNYDPTVATGWTKPDMSAWSSSSAQQFKVPVSDDCDTHDPNNLKLRKDESISGINTVTITVDDNSPTVMAMGTVCEEFIVTVEKEKEDGTTENVDVTPYIWYNSTQILDDGTHSIVVSATDNSGNKAENLATYEVNVDTKAPVYTSYSEDASKPEYVKASKKSLTGKDVQNLPTTPFTLKVTPSDANSSARGGKVSGIKEFKLWDGTALIPLVNADDPTVKNYTISPAAPTTGENAGIYTSGVEYTFTLNASAVNTTGTHNFYIETIDGAGNSVKESVTVSVDVTPPTMSWNIPSPYVTVSENNGNGGSTNVRKYNGIITVSGTVTDETLLSADDKEASASEETRSVSWKICDEDGNDLSTPITGFATLEGNKTSAFSFDIDTTKIQTESGNYRIYITAKDAVGNAKTKAGKDNEVLQEFIELSIDQTTNKPNVSLSNMSVGVSDYDENNKGENLFGMGSNTIYGTVTDDDGISSIVLKIDGETVTNGGNPYFNVSGNPTSYTMQIDLSTINSGSAISAGKHTLSIEVTDSSSSSLFDKKYIENKDTVSGTYFAYDNDIPTISVVRCNDKDYTNNMWGKGEFDVYIQVSDASDVDENGVNQHGEGLTVECTEKKMSANGSSAESYEPYTPHDSDNNPVTETITWSPTKTWGTGDDEVTIENAWKCSTVNVEGYFQRTYKVSDKFGRTTTTSISYIVDTTKPRFDSDYISLFGSSPSITSSVSSTEGVAIGTSKDYWFNSDAVKIIGRGFTTTENGVTTVHQALVEENPESITIKNGEDSYPVNAGKNNAFYTTISFEDGQNTVIFNASDKAGLSATPFTGIVKVDTKAPAIESAEASLGGTPTTEINGTAKDALSTTPFVITVTGASDTNSSAVGNAVSGIKGFKVYRGTEDVTSFATVKTGTQADSTAATKTTDDAGNEYYADGTYYIHLAAGALETGEHKFYVEATDLAENVSTKVSTETIKIDISAPTMSFNVPSPFVSVTESAGNGGNETTTVRKYNGTITVTGTVTDETALKADDKNAIESDSTRSLSWEVRDNEGHSLSTPLTGFAALSGGKTSSFSFSINTKAIEKLSGTYRVYIKAKDKVGNEVSFSGTSADDENRQDYIEIAIDQNTDRPTISFNELSAASGTIRKYTTSITGMITDDDEIAEFYICPGPMNLEDSDEDWETYITAFKAKSSEDQKKILEWTSNASFTYTPEDPSDGNHDLYFYVKDSGGTAYFTKATVGTESEPSESDVLRPYIVLKGQSKIDNAAVTSYMTDANPPSIDVQSYACGTKTSPTGNPANEVKMGEYSDTIPSTFYAGGINNAVLKLKLLPSDVLGIRSVTGTLDSEEIEFEEEKDNQNNPTGYWVSEEIFVGRYKDKNTYSDWASGSYNLVLVVTDNSDLPTTLTKTLTIDNTPPQITANSLLPSSAVLQTGDFTISGSTADVGGGDIETIKYLVIDNEQKEKTDTQLIRYMKGLSGQKNSGTEKMFAFNFNDQENPKFPSTASEASAYSLSRRGDSDYYDIPVYFLMIDTFGNEVLDKTYTVYFNPFSDRPNVELYTPGDGDNLSGPIRVSGSASDNTGVGSVYIQLDVNNDESFTADDMVILLAKGYEVYAVSDIVENDDYSAYRTVGSETLLECPATNIEADSDFWGVKCGGTNSWYVLVNQSDELQIDEIKETIGTDDVYPLRVRAAAIDENGTLGSWSEKVDFKINPNVPTFGSAQNPTIKNSDTGDEIIYSTLSSSSYVGGLWYIVTSVEHSSDISSVSYKVNNGTQVPIVSGKNIVSGWEEGGNKPGKVERLENGNGFKLTLPITEATGEGTYNLTITAVEAGQSKSSTASYSVNYDNEAPTISALIQNDEEWTSDSILKNSNYSLTIGSTVEDGTAGLGKVLFYFYRSDSEKGKRIFDAGMNCKDANGNYAYTFTKDGKNYPGISVDSLSDYDAKTESGETFITVGGYPLYGYKAVGVTRGDTSISDVADNIHVREGSLVLIGNSYHKITKKEVSGTGAEAKMTLTFSGDCSTDITTVFFPYAMSVDNFERESVKKFTADDHTITNDDKDGMPESISGMASSRSWTAQLHANWMPDGPITFVMFAFDGAGNVTAQELDSKLETSGPRLAKLHLGTDLNKNDQFTKNEFETYNFLTVEGTYQDAFALTTKGYKEDIGGEAAESTRDAFKIKDKLAVIPEFTGGNGDIFVVMNNNDETTTLDEDGYIVNPGYVSKTTAGTNTANTLNPSAGTVEELGKYYVFSNEAVGSVSSSTTDYKKMSFTFWDSTDGLKAGSTSQKCFVSVQDFVVWTEDTSNPNVVVDKFFWNGTGYGNNSLYYAKDSNGKYTDTVNGHIELENDWMKTDAYAENEAAEEDNKNAEFDGDPKVSGKIVIRGSAYDDTFLKNITFTMSEFNNEASNEIATYTNGAWVKSTSTLDSTPAYEVLSVTDEYFNQNGHKVIWEIAIDTSTITDTAQTDVSFSAVAVDNATKTSADRTESEEASDSAMHRPSYQMDVVPYIAGIKTGLSSLKKNNSSVYDRTALGHYPVSSTETIWLYGFNLEGAKLYDKAGTASATLEEVTPTASGTMKSWFTNTFAYPKVYELEYDESASKLGISAFTSGPVSVKVHEVESLNNKNKNGAYGSAYESDESVPDAGVTGNKDIYKNFYNRQPNGDNNNNLTDDVVLDVWGINPQAVVPISGVTSQPIMAINPVTHDVGFAFVNGALYYSMPNGNTYSYDNFIGGFDYWTSVAMTYDSLGNSYGTAAGGDINETKADQYRIMTNRWGYADRDAGGYNTATNSLRLEFIGQYDYMYNATSSKYEGFRNFDKERIRSPSLATGTASADSTSVYLAYYDAINDEIRFKWGEFKKTKATTWSKDWDADVKAATLFGDYYGVKDTNAESSDKILDNNNDYSKYRLVHNSWLAGQTSRVYDTNGNTRSAKVITTAGTPVYAGQYVSIAAIPGGGTNDDAVVAVWWDAENSQLLYSYNLTPKSIAVGQFTQEDTMWSTPVPIFDENIGEYCKLALIKESNNNYSVHIVGYDGLNCDIWYAYIPSFTSPSSKKTCVVDSYGLVGTELNIDVALDASGNAIPYISYYASSCAHPKTAHWVGTTSIATAESIDSVDTDESFTNQWEVSVIPTQSRVSIDHINIGVWKNSSGTLNWSTTNGNEPESDNSNIGETKLEYKEVFTRGGNTGYKTGGHVWGNGSKNPILGYSVTKGSSGFIETAQMK